MISKESISEGDQKHIRCMKMKAVDIAQKKYAKKVRELALVKAIQSVNKTKASA